MSKSKSKPPAAAIAKQTTADVDDESSAQSIVSSEATTGKPQKLPKTLEIPKTLPKPVEQRFAFLRALCDTIDTSAASDADQLATFRFNVLTVCADFNDNEDVGRAKSWSVVKELLFKRWLPADFFSPIVVGRALFDVPPQPGQLMSYWDKLKTIARTRGADNFNEDQLLEIAKNRLTSLDTNVGRTICDCKDVVSLLNKLRFEDDHFKPQTAVLLTPAIAPPTPAPPITMLSTSNSSGGIPTASPAGNTYKAMQCYYCRKFGHTVSVCRKKARDIKEGTLQGTKN